MKQIHSALALVAFSAVLAGCATTEAEAPKAAPAPAPAAAAPAPVAAPDAALTKAVTAALAKEAQLAGTKITAAATTDGTVTLTGTVKNDWQQYLAGDIAKKTAGVKTVKNSVKVPD
ncbi:BON domain-containing protein [Herminiimonas fonticola]|uniref:BON domain-containing protein n=1 Tax=Herminiimonas fonticola TaxID=303380 RepID=A0A4R6GFZ8_9BURK|nr:BON domain-containing protein [Herminiimonas fonticola]RBA24656.1 BON domain [Herminiimonas fonticola]TDN93773.1 BON domain-containing protein [Herminiimonas fonticola]